MKAFFVDNKLLITIIGTLISALAFLAWQDKTAAFCKIDANTVAIAANSKDIAVMQKDLEYIKNGVDAIRRELIKDERGNP